MSLRRTSKDLNFLPSSSFFFETKSWQKYQFLSDSNKLANFTKNSSQKSSQKIFPEKFLKKILILKISNSLHCTWRLKTLSGLFFQNSAWSCTTAKNQWGKATRQLWISFGSIQKKQKPGGHLWNANSRKAELEIMRFDNNHRCLFCSCTLCWKLWLFSEIR